MSDLSDQDLLAAVRAGDRAALERLLERHQGAVYRFGAKMCREEEDAKDVLQETLLAAARHLPEFRGASSVSTWLYTIARSFCIKKRRTSKFAPAHVESLEAQRDAAAEVADAARGPEEDAAGRQLQSVLDDAIASLDPMYREVLVLRDVEGLSAAEVGEVMGLSVEAVKSRLHRARVAVRERVAPHLAIPAPTAPGPGCQDVVDAFSRRLEGEIDAAACADLEKHLESCVACRGRCESLRTTLGMCRRAGEAPVPAPVVAEVRAAIRQWLDAQAVRAP
jgi:RNA polymerase sigma-70 factor (ECF subfamily)